MAPRIGVFDLDGTLIDSDEALVAAFVALGIEREAITFGHVIGTECERLGLSLDDYVAAYDTGAARPFAGAAELVAALPTWAVCSNKDARSATAELDRLGWRPTVACFTDTFGGGPKELGPVLDALGVDAGDIVFVGDTAHDRACARAVGAPFALAAWNPRAVAVDGDVVLRTPLDLLAVLG
jgi:HAD superfamily hydrolase (TIGR01549 family)